MTVSEGAVSEPEKGEPRVMVATWVTSQQATALCTLARRWRLSMAEAVRLAVLVLLAADEEEEAGNGESDGGR